LKTTIIDASKKLFSSSGSLDLEKKAVEPPSYLCRTHIPPIGCGILSLLLTFSPFAVYDQRTPCHGYSLRKTKISPSNYIKGTFCWRYTDSPAHVAARYDSASHAHLPSSPRRFSNDRFLGLVLLPALGSLPPVFRSLRVCLSADLRLLSHSTPCRFIYTPRLSLFAAAAPVLRHADAITRDAICTR